MIKDIEKVRGVLDQDRVAVFRAEGQRRDELAAELANGTQMLRFAFPQEEEHFRPFVNGMLNAVVEAAGYASKYPGVVFLEADHDHYIRTDMPVAVLELLKLTTRFRVVIACSSKAMVRHMAAAAAMFGVPGIVELNGARDLSGMVEQSAARAGLRFADDSARREAVRLYETACHSEFFHMDAFLKSLSADAFISLETILAEKNNEFSYLKMCMDIHQDKEEKNRERKIGFASSGANERGRIHVY